MTPRSNQPATALLDLTMAGDSRAAGDLFELLYDELRDMAQRLLNGDARRLTLQPTALVHESYLKLIGASSLNWKSQTHFRAIAARAMRQVMANHLRDGNRAKRGGGWTRVTLSEVDGVKPMTAIELNASLQRLAQADEQSATIIVLKYFGGLDAREIADHLGLTEADVRRYWRRARAWLRADLERDGTPS